MQFSTVLVSLLAVATSAAPTNPKLATKDAWSTVNALGSLSTYFNLVSEKVQAAKTASQASVCDLSNVQMPTAPTALPSPVGLTLHHVALGRGTQNYTCDTTNSSSAPVAAGALATLFNVTCVAALWPSILESLPAVAVNFPVTSSSSLGPVSTIESGHHYFTNLTTPFFNLQTTSENYGEAPCAKNATSPAPTDTNNKGPNGESAVPWLQLLTIDGATDGIKAVYRLTTVGGSAPSTCEGMDAEFQVEYASLYWFYASE